MKKSIMDISAFPKTKACKTEEGITIQGIGQTTQPVRAWDANLGKIVGIPEGTVIQLSGSVGTQSIFGEQITVKRVNVHPYGPEICFRG